MTVYDSKGQESWHITLCIDKKILYPYLHSSMPLSKAQYFLLYSCPLGRPKSK